MNNRFSNRKKRAKKKLYCPTCQRSTVHVLFSNGMAKKSKVKWCTLCETTTGG